MEQKIKEISWDKNQINELLAILQTGENIKITVVVEKEETLYEEEKIIVQCMNRLGISSHLRGYTYLKYGILRCMNYPEELESVTKVLYPNIAKKYQTTSPKVEHGIRHAIANAWERNRGDEWGHIFGAAFIEKKIKPTNSCFLATIADYIRMNN